MKFYGRIPTKSTYWGRRMQVGYEKNVIFNQYLALSRKRHKIGPSLLWKANWNSYASDLSNGVISNDVISDY